jgi:hypothetical protein
MRMMMKVTIPAEGGNKAIKEGQIGKIIGQFLEEQRPEGAYFLTEGGERTALFFMDLKDPSLIPSLAEPFFQALNAKITLMPAMNAQDLKAGLEKLKL